MNSYHYRNKLNVRIQLMNEYDLTQENIKKWKTTISYDNKTSSQTSKKKFN